MTLPAKTGLGVTNITISASQAAAILLSETLPSTPQPRNPVEAPDGCFILLSGQGQLPISSPTLCCFSRHHLSMGRQERRDTRRTCCFSRSKGNRNRPGVEFPAFKKTKDGSSKLWIVTQGELWPGLSVVVMRQRSEDYIASSDT